MAEPTLQERADSGDAQAQFEVAEIYYHGRGLDKDYPEALKWYLKSAAQGNEAARVMVENLRVEGTRANVPEALFWRALMKAVLLGAVLVLVPAALAVLAKGQGAKDFFADRSNNVYTFSIIFLLPFLQGMLSGFLMSANRIGFWKSMGASSIILLADFFIAMVVINEGAICVLMAFPLYFVIIGCGIALGLFIGRRRGRSDSRIMTTLLPLAALFSMHDAVAPPPDFRNAISDAVIVRAPPEVVWHYIVQYPRNDNPPEYWLWKIGLPEPVQSVAVAKKVGAVRECQFTRGIVFKEKITELVPNKTLTFDVTEQPQHPEIIGHFKLEKGQLQLERNADGTTTVIATSWYHLFVSPAAYFDWWASDIVRNVHFRVLNHMKELAEKEYNHERSK